MLQPTDGITARAGDDIEVVYFYDDYDVEGAAAIAADADVAIVFSMSDSGEEYLEVDGNVGDRNNISLWHNGDNLVRDMKSCETLYAYLTTANRLDPSCS